MVILCYYRKVFSIHWKVNVLNGVSNFDQKMLTPLSNFL